MAFPNKPFVGLPGSERSVENLRANDRIVCRLARHTLQFVEVILFLFGLLIAYMSWTMWTSAEAAKTPLYFKIATPALGLICWLAFFRNLFGTPRIEVLLSTGDQPPMSARRHLFE